MFSAIRRRLTYTNVAMTLALVFAMSGGAYAAGKVLITSTKQISPKVLKSLVGKTGKAGAPGAQGPAGPAGPAGATGPAGKEGPVGKGEKGEKGETGAAGKEGKAGTTGFTKTLPKGATETGAWSALTYEGHPDITPISFSIPLASELEAASVHMSPSVVIPSCEGETGPELVTCEEEKKLAEEQQTKLNAEFAVLCPGTASEPKAEPGNLCVYIAHTFGLSVAAIDQPTRNSGAGAGTSGALLEINGSGSVANGWGTWAVTGE